MDSVWHSAPDSRSVPPKDVGATVLSPMSKNKSSDPVGLLLNPCAVPGSMAGPFVSSGVPLGVTLERAFFWDPWSGPLVLWDSFGDQAATRWEPDGDQLGPSGDHMRSSGKWDQVEANRTKWDQVGAKWGPSEDQVGTKWVPNGDQVGTKWGPTTKMLSIVFSGAKWGPNGTKWGPNWDQVGTHWDQVGTKWDQMETRRDSVGTTWGPNAEQVGTRWDWMGTKWGPKWTKWGPSGTK